MDGCYIKSFPQGLSQKLPKDTFPLPLLSICFEIKQFSILPIILGFELMAEQYGYLFRSLEQSYCPSLPSVSHDFLLSYLSK